MKITALLFVSFLTVWLITWINDRTTSFSELLSIETAFPVVLTAMGYGFLYGLLSLVF